MTDYKRFSRTCIKYPATWYYPKSIRVVQIVESVNNLSENRFSSNEKQENKQENKRSVQFLVPLYIIIFFNVLTWKIFYWDTLKWYAPLCDSSVI